MARKFKLQINYKSGTSMVVKADTFRYERNTEGTRKVEWTGLEPAVVLFGIEDVESIWVLKQP